MEYVIVGTSICNYQLWQIKLLYWSFKKVNQSGKLIILLSDDIRHHKENRELNIQNKDFLIDKDVQMVSLPDWAEEWTLANNDWWGGIPNKFNSIKWLCEKNYFNFKDTDRLLFLDPDMCFLKNIEIENIENDQVIGQEFPDSTRIFEKNINLFNDYSKFKEYYKSDAIMYPFCINFLTLKKIHLEWKQYSELIRRRTKDWIAEMFGLDFACKTHNLDLKIIKNLGICQDWQGVNQGRVGNIIHYPNFIKDKNNSKENLFFKQEYTYKQGEYIDISLAQNKLHNSLLTNLTQSNTDFLYYLKWDFKDIFKNYDGEAGYLILSPWMAAFNNLRMSLELAVSLAYLTNRKLVLPPPYTVPSPLYNLKEKSGIEDYFELAQGLGVKHISFKEFCEAKGINYDLESAKSISKVLDYDCVKNVLNFEKVIPPKSFLKNRPYINAENYFTNEECLFLDKNLLGDPEQTIYTSLNTEIKKIIAKYIRYKTEIFDIAWQVINKLKDKSYYAIHIRRGDHQYKELAVPPEVILENIKNIIPEGSKLYIATDHLDESFFKKFKETYEVFFYKDFENVVNERFQNINLNWIPMIEQLICSRSIKFVGNKLSTLSSLIYRIRGYMDDIEDKNYYINTEKFDPSKQVNFLQDKNYIANWARYYKSNWDFSKEKIFVSIASFRDTDVINTIKSLIEGAFDSERVIIGLHLQDTEDFYKKILSYNFKNLRIKFTPIEQTKGVHWARNKIKEELFQNEDYFLQLDSHSRLKKNWDNILINQYKSFDLDKIILSTYPNHFDKPEKEDEYVNVPERELFPFNAPLKVVGFTNPNHPEDNRLEVKNINSLKDYDMVDAYWVSAGFFFTSGAWVKEVTYSDYIIYKGEEDLLTLLSYLKGWNLKITSEATVWHNYSYKLKEKENKPGAENPTTGKPYRTHNHHYFIEDKPIELLNHYLFEYKYKKTLGDLQDYFKIKLKIPEKYKKYVTRKNKEIDYIIQNKKLRLFIWETKNTETSRINSIKEKIKLHKNTLNPIESEIYDLDARSKEKFLILKEKLQLIEDDDIILFSDSEGVLINDNFENLIKKYKEKSTDILVAGERRFTYQWNNFKDRFDNIKETYQYVNASLWMGEAKSVKKMIEEIVAYPEFKDTEIDQGLLGIWVYNHINDSNKVQIDYNASIFWITTDESEEILNIYNTPQSEPIKNLYTGQTPVLIKIFDNKLYYSLLGMHILNKKQESKIVVNKIRNFKKNT